jgi:hypothetical protein
MTGVVAGCIACLFVWVIREALKEPSEDEYKHEWHSGS